MSSEKTARPRLSSADTASSSDGEAEKAHSFKGSGTAEDPYVVEFHKDDPGNPMNWSDARKWWICAIATASVFAVTFTSSAYSESGIEVMERFHCSTEVFTLGISLFVLGFAVGPPVWGSLSELYGRYWLWIISHVAMVAFFGGSAGADSMTTLLVLRFLGGVFGASPLVNSGGAIADIFPPMQRGLAMTLYCVAPFLGPMLGPVVGGFVSENVGWRWVEGVCTIFIGVVGILGAIFIPETYGPALLQQRARKLAKADRHGRRYISVLEKSQGKKLPSEVFRRAMIRPWVLLFREPIVLVASIYMATIYGTMYMFMSAMPIVFNEERHWSEGMGGLAFLGIAVGYIIGLLYAVVDNDRRYLKLFLAGRHTAESRLPPAIVGGICLPVGMFAFAWTSYPSIHWSAPIILATPFGVGCVLVILPLVNYLIDSYTIYAASVLAAAAIFRSVIGASFPLFTTQMYHNLGAQWASSIPAFLTLACLPFPLLMCRYGATLRMKCKYSFEAAEMMKKMQAQQQQQQEEEGATTAAIKSSEQEEDVALKKEDAAID